MKKTEVHLKETLRGTFVAVSVQDIEEMSRSEIIEYLEARGYACYDDEPTSLLRETAFEDLEFS